MFNFFHDLRFGVRTLSKRPGFAATAIITLALGIGLNTTIFSLFNAAVLKQLPVRDASRVVDLYSRQPKSNKLSVVSYPEFVFYREHNTEFQSIAAFSGTRMLLGSSANASSQAQPEWFHGAIVSGNYFDLLGTAPAIGRTFLPEEDRVPGANPVVVLSYGAWQRRFGGNPDLIGKAITLNDLKYTVIGVAPANFIGTEPGLPDFWIPTMMSANAHFGQSWLDQRDSGWLRLIARLKPGSTLQSASSEVAVLASRFHAADDEQTRATTTIVAPAGMLNPDEQSDALPFAILLLAAVTLVLLIACANVANLQLARGLSRQKEMGIRTSLGATRGRLVRQLFAESLVLAGAAGGLGLLLAWWGAGIMLAILQPPGENALVLQLSPDWRVISYALGLALLSAIVSGVVPALRVSRQDPLHAMKEESGASGFHATSKARAFLVVSQVSLAFFLLLGAGLLSRALGRARTVDPGFDANRVAVLSPELRSRNYDANRRAQFDRDLVERIRALPGVQGVAYSRGVPLSTDFMQTTAMAEGKEPPPDQQPKLVNFNNVSADFFATLGISLPRGREFTAADIAQRARVVVVSASLGNMLWPAEDPIGKRLRTGRTSPTYEVIGVANDVRNVYLWSEKTPYLYLPAIPRAAKDDDDPMDAKILVRTNSDPSSYVASLTALSRELDPSVPVSAQVLSENIATWVWPSKLGAAVSTALGLLAMLLAAVGIAGVTSFAVSQRTREIGIRMALGADSRAVVRQFVGQMSRLVLIGTCIGMALGVLASRLLSSFLYGLSALDAFAFAGVTLFLLAVSLVASYIPARRAMRVDPMIALRYE